MTGLGACLWSQEKLELVCSRCLVLDREVHDHLGSSTPEEHVLEGINTQNAQDGAQWGSRNQVRSVQQRRPFRQSPPSRRRAGGAALHSPQGLSDPPGGAEPG